MAISDLLNPSAIQSGLQAFQTVRGIQRQGQQDERQQMLDQLGMEDRQRKIAQGELQQRLQGQQLAVNNGARLANAALQFDTKEELSNHLARVGQDLGRNPIDGIDIQDIADMRNRLASEDGFQSVRKELKADIAFAQDIDTKAQQAKIQFGSQSTFKDSKGNLFFGTTKRNPTTGQVESVLAAIDGSQAQPIGAVEQTGAFGQTAGEKTETKIEEAGATERAKLEATAALIAGVEVEKAKGKSTGALRADIKKAIVQVRRNAPVQIQKLKRVQKIFDKAGTGTQQAFLASLGKAIPGATGANLEAALAAAADFTLDSLSRIKGPITEKELAFIGTTSPNIRNSIEGNKLIINRAIQTFEDQLELAKAQARFKGKPEDFDVEGFIADKEGERNANFDLSNVKPEGGDPQSQDADTPEDTITLPNGIVVKRVQ